MNKRSALVIEDDQEVAMFFSIALQTIGFETEIIPRGDLALERLETAEPDLIILDLRLPRTSGHKVLSHIRAQPHLAEVPVIVTTADARSAQYMDDRADLVLVKPISAAQLRDLATRLGSEDIEASTQSHVDKERT
jgi:CheY-like chemotaxis protein